MKKVIIGIIVVLLVAAIGIGGWYLIDSLKKSNDKVDELENRITKMEENKVSTNNTTNTANVSNETATNTNVTTTNTNESTTNTDTINANTTVDYSKYYGAWVNEGGEFIIKNIGNGYISCSWGIYRIGGIDDVVLPFKDDKAVFYYEGYNDSNYNNVNDEGESYYRKATIELIENGGVKVNIEDTTAEEVNNNFELNKSYEFGGHVYITPGEYVYLEKDETPRR